jgi:HEAT repeat protein
LGARQDARSVPALAGLTRHPNESLAEAALIALGDIGNGAAAQALAAAQKTVPEKLRVAAAEAWMKCAEQLLKGGQAREAAAIYRELDQPRQPRSIQFAALQGTLKSSGDQAADRILVLLGGDDADGQAIAAGFIPDLSSAGLKQLATAQVRLPPATQVMVLGALAERGEKSILPEALVATRSSEESVRLAGFNALGRLGGAGTVPMLVSAMQTAGTSAPARDSLQRLEGAGVNEAIVTAMTKESDASRRAELIGVLEARGAASAVTALLRETASDNPTVRRAALRALGRVAGPSDAPALIQSLLKSAPGSEREDAERAVTSVCARLATPDQQTAPVLAAYLPAREREKAILLPVLGRLGGARALEVLKSALASNDAALSQAGESALANWPDADETVEAELLALAQHAGKPNDRTAALRAYVRAISLPSGLPEKTRLAKYQKAMDLASRDEERNLVLERVTDIKHVETLRFLVPYLDQPALANRAGNTICDLARERGLRERNPAEFEQALNKVVQACKDQAVVDRAKRRLGEK